MRLIRTLLAGAVSPLKRILKALLPNAWVTRVAVQRERHHSHRLNAEWGLHDLSTRLFDAFGGAVQAGPFRGLVLPREAVREHLGPYLLGTYERELHGIWTSLPASSIPLVVNVGAKFGYYAAGLHRLLGAPVVAFDADPWAQGVLRETAALNGANIAVRGPCGRADLDELPAGSLVVIDCEGCEDRLLAPPLPRGLRHSMLVIELHGALVADDAVARRLAETHDVAAIPTVDTPPSPAALPFLNEQERQLAVQEIRVPQRWLYCRPREGRDAR